MNPERQRRHPELRIRDEHFRRVLGASLRAARQELQFSLRDLEARSGVSDSEIYQIEIGSQECRLESFLLIADALGWPPGRLLDAALSRSVLPTFTAEVLSDPTFSALADEFALTKRTDRNFLAAVLAAWCRDLAKLARSSNGRRCLADINLNLQSIVQPFRELAERLDTADDPLSRLEILDGLAARPVIELRRLGFLSDAVLMELGAVFSSPEKMRSLAPLVPVAEKGLTQVTLESNSRVVSTTLDALIDRLKTACCKDGKRSELAAFLNVPLPRVSEWLAGVKRPGGETTLRLLQWVVSEESREKKHVAAPKAAKPASSSGSKRPARKGKS